MALSHKQQVWIENYLITWNATEAARRAGYAHPNVEGPKNLVKPSLKARIDARLAELQMSADEALVRLADMARGSLAEFADVQLLADLKEHPKAHLVKTLTTDVYEDKAGKIHYKTRFELYDAQAALRDILRIHGKFANDAGSSEDKPVFVKFVKGIDPDDL